MRAAWVGLIFLGGLASSAEPALPPDPHGAFPSEARKARLKDEIADAGPGHPWAGDYYEGDGLGSNNSLLIAPSGEYSFESHGCTSFGPTEEGKIRQEGDILHFDGDKTSEMAGRAYRVVPWGKRVYLISEGALVSFANSINFGSEPRYSGRGFYFMRDGGEDHIATGWPLVPEEIKPYLLDHAIDATITAVGASTVSTEPYSSKDFKTEVVLDVGRREGILPEMELDLRGERMGQAEITLVRDRTSTAILSSTSPPAVGWQLSTRWDFLRGTSPTDQPYRIKVTTSTDKVYLPIQEEWTEPLDEEDTYAFSEAPENGFTVTEVARIEYSSVNRDLMHGKIFMDKISEVLTRLGANAYVAPFRSSRDSDPYPWSHVQELVAYRIEHGGLPLNSIDFMRESDSSGRHRLSWAKTRTWLLHHASKYTKEYNRVYGELQCQLLRLSRSQCADWSTLKFEDLNPDQLQAINEHWGSRRKRGLVAEASPPYDAKWRDSLRKSAEIKMKAVQAADPKAYAEYRRLEAILYPEKP